MLDHTTEFRLAYPGGGQIMSDATEELWATLRKLLHSIQRGDVEAYRAMVSPALTCFEPATAGHRIEGLEFHLFMSRNHPPPSDYHLEIVSPVIRAHENIGYVAYTLLASRATGTGVAITTTNETRVFERHQGQWKMVHFHRSAPP
jgi:hypothetical protein